jgi:hypothetical protein
LVSPDFQSVVVAIDGLEVRPTIPRTLKPEVVKQSLAAAANSTPIPIQINPTEMQTARRRETGKNLGTASRL